MIRNIGIEAGTDIPAAESRTQTKKHQMRICGQSPQMICTKKRRHKK